MTRKELIERAAVLAKKETVTTEDRAAFDRLIAQVDEIDNREFRGPVPPRPNPGDYAGGPNYSGDSAEKRSFAEFIRTGKGDYERRDMTTSGAAAAIVPQEFYPVLTQAQKAWGAIVNIVNLRETDNGAPMKVAYANDTGNLAHVVGEPATVNETDPTLSSTLLSCDQLVTDIVKVSIPELQDTAFDIDKFIRDQFGKRYYRGLSSLMTAGSTSGNIASIITGATTGATSAGPTAIAYADIVALYSSLDPAYIENATWVMNATTRAALMGVTDTLGRPLFIPNPSTGAFDRLLGCPVVLNQYMASIGAGNVALQFGDYSQGYLLRLVKPGLAIARLNERYMDTLEVGFIGYFRAAGIVTDAGTHPIKNLVQHA